jgi:hypothetical protein
MALTFVLWLNFEEHAALVKAMQNQQLGLHFIMITNEKCGNFIYIKIFCIIYKLSYSLKVSYRLSKQMERLKEERRLW